MKTIEQIALSVAQEMDILWFEGKESEDGIVKQEAIDFAQKFLAAWLAQQEPVAWVSGHLRYAFERTERYVPIAVEVSLVNMGWKNQIPLFLAPPPAIPEGMCLVPKEPTEEMCAEGCLKVGALYGNHGARSMYQAMIAAAPKGDQE